MIAGIGCTFLAKGLRTGHPDGIGIYTAELLKAFHQNSHPGQFERVIFGSHLKRFLPGALALPVRYPLAVLGAAATGLPFARSNALAEKIDIFHATDHHIPKLGRTPVVATVMDVIGLRHPEWVNPSLRALKNMLFAKATTWAQHVITISDFSAQDIASCLKIPRAKITSIPLGVDPKYFDIVEDGHRSTVLSRYGLRPGYFVFVGTLQPRKNISRIVAAHAALPASLRKLHPLVIVGQKGWLADGLIDELAQLESSGCGRWLRYVPQDDIFSILQAAHALVFPSLYEGFGLPVLEGFASRIPVITSNTTSLPEVAGDAGILVNPESTEHIADAMLRTVDDESSREILIQKGLDQARRFTWDETARRTMAIYRSMLG